MSNVDPVAHAKYILELLARDGTPGMGVSFGEAAMARVVIAAESVVKNAKVFCPSVDEHATGAFASQDDMWVALDALAAALKWGNDAAGCHQGDCGRARYGRVRVTRGAGIMGDIAAARAEIARLNDVIEGIYGSDPCPKCGYGVGPCYGCKLVERDAVIDALRAKLDAVCEAVEEFLSAECVDGVDAPGLRDALAAAREGERP